MNFTAILGVIDADFTGNIGVVLFNHSTTPLDINAGDRIAQLICERISYPSILEVFDDVSPTDRGADGFGSTGVRRDESTTPEKK